ncbi:galactoside permease [Raoultella terrigena]|uniref:Galactoside permease n=1 Tax=Raoultella terrigena TaxID=577 RepID=A0A4U9D9D6_RAOTE|nr:galactoside permease [Raoultella terrigena]
MFVASIATAIYSPLAGYLYDTIGFARTYYILGGIAGLFTLISVFTLRDSESLARRALRLRETPPNPRVLSRPGAFPGFFII